jgi:hypothetical protein
MGSSIQIGGMWMAPGNALACVRGGPGLIGVEHQRGLVAEGRAQLAQARLVLLRCEADLHLERAVAALALLHRQGQGLVRMQAGGVNASRAACAAQHAPQRLAGATGRQVPSCEIDGSNALRQRAGLAGLDGEYAQLGVECLPQRGDIGPVLAQRQRRDGIDQQPRAVLRAHAWEVAPHLAPALRTVSAGDSYEHRRPVAHRAKGRHDRRVDGRAQCPGINAREAAQGGRRGERRIRHRTCRALLRPASCQKCSRIGISAGLSKA